jgi:hypothetical protein
MFQWHPPLSLPFPNRVLSSLPLHIGSAGTSNWTKLEALGTIVSAMVLVFGAYTASRYGHRANGRVTVTGHKGNGVVILSVRMEVSSRGLRRFVLAPERPPSLVIREVLDGGLDLSYGRTIEPEEAPFTGEDVVDPGEVLTTTNLYPVPQLPAGALGWALAFKFAVERPGRFAEKNGLQKRRWIRRNDTHKTYWQWEDRAFLPFSAVS